MEKHGLASKQSRGRLGTALFCEQSQAKSTERERERVKELESKAERESALGNLKLILNCLENHHAASSSAFDGRKKPAAFIPLQDLFSPPAVKQIRQRRSCSWYNFRGKGRANCWLGAKRDEACFSCLLCPAPDNVSLASSKTGTHGGLRDSLRPLVPTLVCLHSARHLGGQEAGGMWSARAGSPGAADLHARTKLPCNPALSWQRQQCGDRPGMEPGFLLLLQVSSSAQQ